VFQAGVAGHGAGIRPGQAGSARKDLEPSLASDIRNGSPSIANPPGRPLHILRVERSVDRLPSAGRTEV